MCSQELTLAKASQYNPGRQRAPIVNPQTGAPEPMFTQFLNDVAEALRKIEELEATVADLQDQIDAKCP